MFIFSRINKIYVVIFQIILFGTYSSCFSQHNSTVEGLDSLLVEAKKATDELRNEAAITMAAKLIERAEVNNEYNYLFYGYDLLGQNHLYLSDTSVAGEYTNKALNNALKSKNDTLIVTAFTNRAAWLGLDEKKRGEAIKLYLSALKIARKSVRDHIAPPALDLASLYYKMAKYELMPRNLREAEENLQGLKYDVTKEEIQLNILWGDYFKEENGENLVAEYYNISYNLIKNRNDPALALDFYPKYARFLSLIDSSQAAYKVQLQYQKIKDDLENERRAEEVQKAMAAAGADELRRERNEAELREMLVDEKLERKNTQYTLMFILTVLMLFFIIYMYISTRMRKSLIKDLKYKNTELKAAKELAEDSVLAKSEFFSTVSHEMRTPLYGVTGMVNVLQNSKAADGFHEEFDSLKFSALHLLDIINDLLELSKLDDNSFEFHEHTFDIDLFVREIIKSFEKSQLKNSNKIHYIPEGDYPKMFIGDSRRIAQVLINLISNAVKFTVDGDIYIRFSCEYLKGSLRKLHFEVEDTGHGIPENSLTSIFKEFNQIESPGIERKMGTGLGLPIVQKILRKMNSEIHVESEVGKGSIFSFDICLKEAQLQSSENESLHLLINSMELDKTLDSSKILIVDDNKVNRIVTQRLLEQKRIEVMTAAGGKEAIQLMIHNKFDLVLMDLQMPEMDGYETVDAIRKFDSSTPIVALTASEIHTMKKRLKECGFNDSVTKPFNLQEFYSLIAKNLSSEPRIPIA